jgi:DNA-binding response OmpR family regulator
MNKILVIEDDTNIRNNVVEILEVNGYKPKAAVDGEEAIDILKSYLPDLIISDILMPNLTGLELKERLETSNTLKKIPFIFLSAKADLQDIREGMNLGADDYLTKPFKLADLLKTIKIRLSKQQENKDEKTISFQDNQIDELKHKLERLTGSERRVLSLLAKNFSSVEIGKKLFLSTKTVQNHRANMVRKLKFTGSNSLLDFAIRCTLAGIL